MKAILNYRYYLLTILVMAAVIGIFSEPADSLSSIAWLIVTISTKATGFFCGWLCGALIARWDTKGTIPELSKFIQNF